MLTVEQKKLVEDNERFIYFALQKLHFSIQDYYGAAAVGMCKAASTWDSSKSAFSTWAWSCIQNECWHEGRKEKRNNQISIAAIRIDQPVSDDNDSEFPQIPSDDCFTECMEDKLAAVAIYTEAQKKMTPKEKAAFELYLKGRKQREIAKIIGISQSYVSRMILNSRRKCAESI